MSEPANYYGCLGKHQEHDCLSQSYFNKRFTRDRWCAVCKERFQGKTVDND
jgi:hypothetical protein